MDGVTEAHQNAEAEIGLPPPDLSGRERIGKDLVAERPFPMVAECDVFTWLAEIRRCDHPVGEGGVFPVVVEIADTVLADVIDHKPRDDVGFFDGRPSLTVVARDLADLEIS